MFLNFYVIKIKTKQAPISKIAKFEAQLKILQFNALINNKNNQI